MGEIGSVVDVKVVSTPSLFSASRNNAPKSNPFNSSTALSNFPSSSKLITPIVRCSVPNGLMALTGMPLPFAFPFPFSLFGVVVDGVEVDVDVEVGAEAGPAAEVSCAIALSLIPVTSSSNFRNEACHCGTAFGPVSGRQRKCVSGGRFLGGCGGIKTAVRKGQQESYEGVMERFSEKKFARRW